MLDSSTLHSATIEERGILFWSAASSDIKMPNGLAAIAATIIMMISRIRSTAQPPRAATAEPTAFAAAAISCAAFTATTFIACAVAFAACAVRFAASCAAFLAVCFRAAVTAFF